MTNEGDGEAAGSKFSQALDAAARMPMVKVDRPEYLRKSLERYCTDDQIERAIAESPAAAGISFKTITKVADTSIAYEVAKVSLISTGMGIPGGWGMMGTVPADAAQYVGHMLRVAQKLAYIYGWPDLFRNDGEIDEATEGILTLFLGVMAGVQAANTGVSKVSAMIAAQVVKKLPQQALTKGVIYPIVKKVAGLLGVRMTKKVFATGVSKVVPVVGGVVSGTVTLVTFRPMSKVLQKHLAGLELTKPGHRQESSDAAGSEDEEPVQGGIDAED